MTVILSCQPADGRPAAAQTVACWAVVGTELAPFRTAVALVSTIPGVSALSAQIIVSEIGTDMSRFPTADHLVSWAGLCPRNDESAGKRRSNRLRKGATWLKTALIQCAWAAKRKKGSYLQAQFFRLQARRGPQKAICAVAASILTAAYNMLKDGTEYHDLGPDHFSRRSRSLKHNVSSDGSKASDTPSRSPQSRSRYDRGLVLGARAPISGTRAVWFEARATRGRLTMTGEREGRAASVAVTPA